MQIPEKCLGCGSDYVEGNSAPGAQASVGDTAKYACGSKYACRDFEGVKKPVVRNCPKHRKNQK